MTRRPIGAQAHELGDVVVADEIVVIAMLSQARADRVMEVGRAPRVAHDLGQPVDVLHPELAARAPPDEHRQHRRAMVLGIQHRSLG
jgi:hypothetical protein